MNAVALARNYVGLAKLAIEHSRMNGRVPRWVIEARVVAECRYSGVRQQRSVRKAVDAQPVDPAGEDFDLSIAIYVGGLNGGVIHRLFPPQPITELRKCDALRLCNATDLPHLSKCNARQQNEPESEN